MSIEQLKSYEGKTFQDYLTVVECYDEKCKVCKDIVPDILIFQKQLKMRNAKVKFRRLDVDEQSRLADTWKIRKLPTFVFLKNDRVVKTLVSSDPHEIKDCIRANATIPRKER